MEDKVKKKMRMMKSLQKPLPIFSLDEKKMGESKTKEKSALGFLFKRLEMRMNSLGSSSQSL